MNATATAGSVEMIDPHVLILEQNIRTEAPIDKAFVETIRQEGVLQPVLGWRDSEGVHVRAGQRRTLGAREAGVATIPVYVVDVDPDNKSEADRLVRQLIENEQRVEISDTDRAEAWKAMELEGMSVAAIAKRTGAKRDRVKTGIAVASSETGTRLIGDVGLTLDQAATLLEFEDDPELVAKLTETALSDAAYFPHAVEQARQERARRVVIEAVEQTEAAKGHRILSEQPEHGQAPWPINSLRTADGERVDIESIHGKPGVAVLVQMWSYQTEPSVSHYVDDPEALGLTLSPYATSGAPKGPMTDEQKAERKTLIANNKAWEAAEVVRREWLTSFFARKTLPKDVLVVTATLLTTARREVSDAVNHGNSLAADLLGIEGQDDYLANRLATYVDTHPTKAAHVALAVVIGGVESSTSRDTWRRPNAEAAKYLNIIAGWGYALSPVEKIAALIDEETAGE